MKFEIVKSPNAINIQLKNSIYIDPRRRNFYNKMAKERNKKEIMIEFDKFCYKKNIPHEIEDLIFSYLDFPEQPLRLILLNKPPP